MSSSPASSRFESPHQLLARLSGAAANVVSVLENALRASYAQDRGGNCHPLPWVIRARPVLHAWELRLRIRQASSIDFLRLVPILEGMREILLRCDLLTHADLISQVIDSANLELPDFLEKLLWGGVWNTSAGNILDCPLDRRDQSELDRLYLRLGGEMHRQGIRDRGVQETAGWLRERLPRLAHSSPATLEGAEEFRRNGETDRVL